MISAVALCKAPHIRTNGIDFRNVVSELHFSALPCTLPAGSYDLYLLHPTDVREGIYFDIVILDPDGQPISSIREDLPNKGAFTRIFLSTIVFSKSGYHTFCIFCGNQELARLTIDIRVSIIARFAANA